MPCALKNLRNTTTLQPKVLILLCTFNGAEWLQPQLESIAAQDLVDWSLWISDDGSSDSTLEIAASFRACHPDRDIRVIKGPKAGPAQNFLSLLNHQDLPLSGETLVALCDQDDIWLPLKLHKAASTLLAQSDQDRPLIYGAQSIHINEMNERIGLSRRPVRGVVLSNALVQNMVSGHSLMLNPAAVNLARKAGCPQQVAFHDWWLSLLVLACGGHAIVSFDEVLLYRQHHKNVMGSPQGIRAHFRRLGLLFANDYARWVAANLDGLSVQGVPLSPVASEIVTAMKDTKGGVRRARMFGKYRIHRQERLGTVLLYLATLLGRV